MPASRPCQQPGCPELTAGTYCATHLADEARRRREGGSPGTTTAWRRAREAALRRDRYRCTKCGRTQAEAKAAGTVLEVHHIDGMGGGVGATTHDLGKLTTLCRSPCHQATYAETLRQQRRPKPGGDSHRPPWMLD